MAQSGVCHRTCLCLAACAYSLRDLKVDEAESDFKGKQATVPDLNGCPADWYSKTF